MSRNVAVAIVGSGKTTRSNVESLIGDFKDAVDSLTLIVPTTGVSDGMTWAKQYAQEHELAVIEDETVYAAIEELKLTAEPSVELKFFLLWDDDDTACQEAVAFAQKHNLPVFDLTDGLVRVSIDEIKVEAPEVSTMPASETNVKEEPQEQFTVRSFGPPPKESIFEAEQDPLIDWDEEDEYEDDYSDLEGAELIEAALHEAGRIFARAFVDEMLYLLSRENDGKDK